MICTIFLFKKTTTKKHTKSRAWETSSFSLCHAFSKFSNLLCACSKEENKTKSLLRTKGDYPIDTEMNAFSNSSAFCPWSVFVIAREFFSNSVSVYVLTMDQAAMNIGAWGDVTCIERLRFKNELVICCPLLEWACLSHQSLVKCRLRL